MAYAGWRICPIKCIIARASIDHLINHRRRGERSIARKRIESYHGHILFACFTHVACSRTCMHHQTVWISSRRDTSDFTNAAISVYIRRLWAYICRHTWKVYTVSIDGDLARRLPRARYFSTAGHVYTSLVRNIARTLPRFLAGFPFDVERTCNGKSRNEIPPWSARGKSVLFFRVRELGRRTWNARGHDGRIATFDASGRNSSL